jgi:hypothetical protein
MAATVDARCLPERITIARRVLDTLREDDRWMLRQRLVAIAGCTHHEAEVLLAERDATARCRAAGLDAAPVRRHADELLHPGGGGGVQPG